MGLTIKDQLNPNGDIEIKFSGLRPGEKLYEELLIDDNAKKTQHKRILSANERSLPWNEVKKIISDLNDAMRQEDVPKIKQILIEAHLGYQPNPSSILKPKNKADLITDQELESSICNAVQS
jgi:FlaA1/EpsC-like NDP-sugar epimerase